MIRSAMVGLVIGGSFANIHLTQCTVHTTIKYEVRNVRIKKKKKRKSVFVYFTEEQAKGQSLRS